MALVIGLAGAALNRMARALWKRRRFLPPLFVGQISVILIGAVVALAAGIPAVFSPLATDVPVLAFVLFSCSWRAR